MCSMRSVRLPSRPLTDASEALSPQIEALMTSEASVREKAIEVAAILGIKDDHSAAR